MATPYGSILVYKCLNDLVPQCLCDYFSRNHSNCFYSYNTRRREDIHPSRPKLSLGKRTFRYSAAILFNSLPETYKRAASLEAFKRLLMKHDFPQGWTLALARSPRRVSKVSGECKSQITRPFGECDFSSPRN